MPFRIPKPTFDPALVDDIEAYLDQHYQTEIEHVAPMQQTGGELKVTFAIGRTRKSYPRPMFQIIPRDAFSSNLIEVKPCESCDNFAKSWACSDHPELEWNAKARSWNRPCTGEPVTCRCPECIQFRADQIPARPSGASGILAGLYEQMNRQADLYAGQVREIRPVGTCNCNECTALRNGHPTHCRCLSCLNRQRGRGPRVERFNPAAYRYDVDPRPISYVDPPQRPPHPSAEEMIEPLAPLDLTPLLEDRPVYDFARDQLGPTSAEFLRGITSQEMDFSATFELSVEGETTQGGNAFFSIEVENPPRGNDAS